MITSVNKRQSDSAISRGFYFHETSHMRSFAKFKPSRKFPNLQYIADMCDDRMGNMSIFCASVVYWYGPYTYIETYFQKLTLSIL